MEAGRYSFVIEPWHGACGVIANELLLRVHDEDGALIPFAEAFSVIKKYNLQYDLDMFLIAKELQWAKKQQHIWPLTLNISVDSVLSGDFWCKIELFLQNIDKNAVIFEILEHEVPDNADISVLKQKKAEGIRFALDDFQPIERDWKRLELFAPVLDFIKFDGPLVRRMLQDEKLLDQTLNDVKKLAPLSVGLIAEWANSLQEASFLFRHGILAVQSKYLDVNASNSYKWKELCPN